MAFPYPQYREKVLQLCQIPSKVAVPVGDWSGWQKLIVPERGLGRDYKDRSKGHVGSYRKGRYLPGDGVCGIYEWKMVNPDVEEDSHIVYLGSSCSKGNAPLRNRILQYCKNGSHKREEINDALRKGYVLYVRYRQFQGNDEANEAENYLLGKYNYAWNEHNNAIRKPIRQDLQD